MAFPQMGRKTLLVNASLLHIVLLIVVTSSTPAITTPGDLAPVTGSTTEVLSSADVPTTPTCPSVAVERFCGRDLAIDNAAYLAVKRGGCVADNGQYMCPGGYVLDARTFFAANTSSCQAACSADGTSLGMAQDYQWTVSDWAPCPVRCGGALQTRHVACSTIITSELVPDWYCPAETQPAAQRSCGDAPCAALGSAPGVVQLGPWGECAQGIAVRSVRCVGAAIGVPVAVHACTADGGVKLGMLAKPCTIANTSSPSWRLGDWTPCSAQCGGGTRNRTVQCMHAPTNRILSLSACERAANPRPPSTSTCNTAPCIAYTYLVSPWSPCSALCGGGTRNRTVECVDPIGGPSTDCRGMRPPALQRCNESPCAGTCGHCSGRGRCVDGACRCGSGWSGKSCDISTASCGERGRVDASGQCCAGGRVDVHGRCCAGGVLDVEGRCCLTTVDGCGVCGGRGVLDVEGRCCGSGVLDAGGLCCEGVVDECGVCDGDGRSCDVVAAVVGGGAPPTTQRGVVRQESSVRLGLSADGAALEAAVQEQQSLTTLLLRLAEMGGTARVVSSPVHAIGRRAVCGNGVCELDEVVECPGDCPLPWRTCNCAAGSCLFGSGVCYCWTGYEGDQCERCAHGFARDSGGGCSFVASTRAVGSQSAGAGVAVLALGVTVGVLGVVAVAACTALVMLVRLRRGKPVRYRRRRASSVRAVMALHS